MQRLQRFANNAGTFGTLQTLVVVVILFFAIRRDFVVGHWIVTVPILAVVLGVAFVARDFLVDNIHWMQWAMNAVAAAGIIVFIISRGQSGPEPLWLRATLAGCIGLYIGCYFWMLSDPRVARAG